MLKYLKISNMAVVASAELSFGPGLTLLTGERGAGKSILVDAVGLLAGGRASSDLIRTGESQVVVFQQAPETFHRAMILFVMLLPFLGAAAMVRRLSVSNWDRMLLIGFIIGAVCVQLLRLPVLVAVPLAAAGGWLGVRSRGA